MSQDALVHLTAVLVLIGVIVSDLELLATPAQMRSTGLYSWSVLRTARPWTVRGPLAGPLAAVLDVPGVLGLIAAQLACATAALVGWGGPLEKPALLGTLAAALLIHLRNLYGMDGSDQMQSVVLVALAVYVLAPTETGRKLAFGFIAAQAILSYFSAGYAKLISRAWRSGAAVLGVLNTRSYGGPWLARVVARRPHISRAFCWGTLVFECLLPLLVFFGHGPCLVFIVVGLGFHAGIAATMGLNIFFWSFVSTYPALYFVSGIVS